MAEFERNPEIVIVGSTMVDLVAYSPSLPVPGETVRGTAFEKNFGGENLVTSAFRIFLSSINDF